MRRPSRLDPEASPPGPWSKDEFIWRITTFNLFGYQISLLPLVFILIAVLIFGPPLAYFFQLRDMSAEDVLVMMGLGLTASLFFTAMMDVFWIIRLPQGVRKAIWNGAIISILSTSAAVYSARFFPSTSPDKQKPPPSAPAGNLKSTP